jgi:hypothetical protein
VEAPAESATCSSAPIREAAAFLKLFLLDGKLQKTGLALVDLRLDAAVPVLLLGNFTLDPVGFGDAVFQLRLQHGDGAFQLRGAPLLLGNFVPDRFQLQVLLMHSFREGRGVFIISVYFATDGGFLRQCGEIIRLVFLNLLRQAVQAVHPDGNFKASELVPQEEILFRRFSLLPESRLAEPARISCLPSGQGSPPYAAACVRRLPSGAGNAKYGGFLKISRRSVLFADKIASIFP